MLKSLKTGKACGNDGINNRILKELRTELAQPLCSLFNMSIHTSIVPDVWKEANVTPIFKKNDPSVTANYRPISLLSAIGKAFEKIVHKRLFDFLAENNILSPLQSGFVPCDSTANQLVDIYNTFCKALDDGKEVRAIFCDISKAFDRVWHKGLIYKLETTGIKGRLLNWFHDYLSNRRQRVVIPGATSDWAYIKAGVPQGSTLGPLLFLIYINDIVGNIHCNIKLFADDTSLYIVVNNPIEAAELLNNDLETITDWANQWIVRFNPSKTENLLISRKTNRINHPPILMQEQRIEEVTEHKHLGIFFSKDGTWHAHIDYIKAKAWKRTNIMRKLKFRLDRKALTSIYIAFIRPVLEYADVVWDNCTIYESKI